MIATNVAIATPAQTAAQNVITPAQVRTTAHSTDGPRRLLCRRIWALEQFTLGHPAPDQAREHMSA